MNMTPNPLISVIMPAYNAEAYITQAINSILSQTYSNFELIILNDGSTDQTEEIVQSFSDKRIQYIKNQRNLGIAATLNKGSTAAQGEYIARMDADDICFPVRLEHQINFFESHPSIGVLGSAIQLIDRRSRNLHRGLFPNDDALIRWSMMYTNPIAHPTVMIRRKLFLSSNGYRDVPAEDHDLWERMSNITSFANLPEVLLYLRRFTGTKTEKNTLSVLESSAKISHRIIARILGTDLSENLVQKLWGKEFETSQDAIDLSELITRLLGVYSLNVSPNIIGLLHRDASRRLVKIATRKKVNNTVRLQILYKAVQIEPLILVVLIKSGLFRIWRSRMFMDR
jgi:glycosyltransferase involved in cell wall biosynthesis